MNTFDAERRRIGMKYATDMRCAFIVWSRRNATFLMP
jgi:hypothetical protein